MIRTLFEPDFLYAEGKLHRAAALAVDPDGKSSGVVTDPKAPGNRVRLRGKLLLPGLVNVHSHAFQRAIRGRTESSPGREQRRLLELARADVRAADRARPRRGVRRLAAGVPRDGARRGSPRWASSTTSTTAPTARPTPTRTSSRSRSSGAAREVGLRIVLLARRLRPRGPRRRRRTRRQRRFIDPDRRRLPRRAPSRSLAALARGPARLGRARAAQRPRGARATGSSGSPRPAQAGCRAHAPVRAARGEPRLRGGARDEPDPRSSTSSASPARTSPRCTASTSRTTTSRGSGARGLERLRLPVDRAEPRRRGGARGRAARRRRAALLRLGQPGAHRPARGGAAARGAPPADPAPAGGARPAGGDAVRPRGAAARAGHRGRRAQPRASDRRARLRSPGGLLHRRPAAPLAARRGRGDPARGDRLRRREGARFATSRWAGAFWYATAITRSQRRARSSSSTWSGGSFRERRGAEEDAGASWWPSTRRRRGRTCG